MSSLNWKSRTFIAVATASLLTGAGAVALANTVATPASAPTSSTANSTSAPSSADALQQSLDALAAQADSLAQSVADGAASAGTGSASRATRDSSGTQPAATTAVVGGSEYQGDDDSGHDSDGCLLYTSDA